MILKNLNYASLRISKRNAFNKFAERLRLMTNPTLRISGSVNDLNILIGLGSLQALNVHFKFFEALHYNKRDRYRYVARSG